MQTNNMFNRMCWYLQGYEVCISIVAWASTAVKLNQYAHLFDIGFVHIAGPLSELQKITLYLSNV